jgi:Ca2+-binding RTX toxin-like protein
LGFADDGADRIFGDDGNDILLGDNGTIDKFTRAAVTDPLGGAGIDFIFGGQGNDTIFGGGLGDKLTGDAVGLTGDDVIVGDQGSASATNIASFISSVTGSSGDDLISGSGGNDSVIAGDGDDQVSGDGVIAGSVITRTLLGVPFDATLDPNAHGSDILLGDNASINLSAGVAVLIQSTNPTSGGSDTIYGDAEDDILVGETKADNLDGGTAQDLIFGDNVTLTRNAGSGDAIDPRFRALTGSVIYGPDGSAQIAPELSGNPVPGGRPAWADFTITLDPSLNAAQFGNDYIAGGAGNDQIFGQLGDDIIQGDGSVLSKTDNDNETLPVSAARDAAGLLVVQPSSEAAGDGDDYIEGNGGNDLIFGNLGQDDIIGGNSSLFSLITPSLRPDGADLIFGGAGIDVGRNDNGDLAATGHSRDADMILGDNGNIFRLVVMNGGIATYLTFNYDNYSPSKIVARAAQWIDYTPGGPDFTAVVESGPADIAINPTTNVRDIGSADEIHGESGDDFIYGLVGADLLFGDGQNDVIIGGYGPDWISGGTGDDGILGDDGRLFVSRNSTSFGEPLYGIAAIPGNAINQPLNTGGGDFKAILNPNGLLKYTADLTPANLDPNTNSPNLQFRPLYANDIIYGGLGHDGIHSGAGDDAISGGEAPAESYTNNYNQAGQKLNATPIRSDFFHPVNPGNVLGYNPVTTKFDLYDATDTFRKILLTPTGTLSKTGTGLNWILNFSHENTDPVDTFWIQGTAYPGARTDGDDHIFADLGNDWLVGGTGRDSLWAGWGDDLLNADDNLETSATNDSPDTNPSFEDLSFGGAGLDVLIANTNGDRLVDWVGEFNTYVTPFSQIGAVSVNRLLTPQLPAYLYAVSRSQGADQTLGTNTSRNGEPFGEIALVVQQDAQWQDQNGPPRDPQVGNTRGNAVDVSNNPGTAGTQAIYLTADAPATSPDMADVLTESELAQVIAMAKQFWSAQLGSGDSRLAMLDSARIEVGNLPDLRLGATFGGLVLIDVDAAGYGWSMDSTSSSGMDPLRVVQHEMGHLLGFDHDSDGLMNETLAAGQTSTSSESVDYSSSKQTKLIDWTRDTPANLSTGGSIRFRELNKDYPDFLIERSGNRDNGKNWVSPQKKRHVHSDEEVDTTRCEMTDWYIEV